MGGNGMGLSKAAEWAHKMTLAKACQPKFQVPMPFDDDGDPVDREEMQTIVEVAMDGNLAIGYYRLSPGDARSMANWILETFKNGDGK